MAGPSLAWLAPAASMLSEEQLASAGAPGPTMSGAFDVPPPPPPPPLATGNIPGAIAYGENARIPGAIDYAPAPRQMVSLVRDEAPPPLDFPPSQVPGSMTSALGPGESPTPPDPLMPKRGIDPSAIPGPQPAPPQEPPPDVQFRQAGGGAVPAHEADIRGPRQNAHLMASFDDPMAAADRMEDRSRWLAEQERNAYELQADHAMKQQEASEKVAMQRQAQLERLQMDYEDQVQKMGQMHLDSNRWWASKSTGDKITTGILAFIGGLGALDPRGNGRNLAYEAIMRDADQDVEAQKFDAMMQQGQVDGARNTFGMALQRYQNEDAATAATRAAAIDYSLAKLGELQAQWKGADVANAADDLRARLSSERERTIAAGIRFVPAQASPGRYQMMVRGQMAPGTFSEKEAQNVFLEHQVKPAEKYDEQTLGIGGQMAIAAQKANAEARAKAGEHAVQLSNGEVVNAPNEAEAAKLREATVSVSKTKALVAEARKIRSEGAWRVDPKARARLGQVQAELLTDFGVQHQLGALSDTDYKIAQDGTADLFQLGPGPEARLDAMEKRANAKLATRVSTYVGASPKAAGKMPAGFTPHGGK